ncbi:MAG: hypothetical protein IT364_12215 [Candidatus Hydrogenedentes bacterium]|nr:hypothetical protein [Candidatus Hydrogenedentota bacterium]
MKRLKADLHTHTADDPFDSIAYSAETLIDAAADAGVEVLAITCHEFNAYSAHLSHYARGRGVLLIPGMEKFISGKHVLILNPHEEHLRAHTFEDLRTVGRLGAVFVAPHPYYPSPNSLLGELERNIDLFDAIEWSSLYVRMLNPNRRAAGVARAHRLPLLGTSDTHVLPYEDTTFSWIEAEPAIEGIVEAILAGRVTVETQPKKSSKAARSAFGAVRGMVYEAMRA